MDKEKEKARLTKERDNLLAEITRVKSKLDNESFVSRAPANVVEAERSKLAVAEEKLSKVNEELGKLLCRRSNLLPLAI